ncbi:hypothetical protein [Streptomyces sp. NPDC058964]|uniref:hypothetical protein n=1 Tax=Streptomyces sp. NPDC058964 TaxID=3346681 RepID=UPI0036A7C659
MHGTRYAGGALAVPDGVLPRAGDVRGTTFTGPRRHADLDPGLAAPERARTA